MAEHGTGAPEEEAPAATEQATSTPEQGVAADPNMQEALGYTARGWRVIPIKPGSKRPAMKGWPDLATTDPAQVEKWWGHECVGWGVGLALGRESGVFAVDVDPRHDGELTLFSYETQTGRSLPPTLTSRTGGGGWHYIYRYPTDARVGNNGHALMAWSTNGEVSGVEVKSDRTQVVLPPSSHPSGEPYAWEDPLAAPAEMPGEVLEDLLGRLSLTGDGVKTYGSAGGLSEEQRAFYDAIIHEGARVPVGFRDVFFNARAFSLRRAGLPREDVLRDLHGHWRRTDQPYDHEYTWEMVVAKVDRVWETVDVEVPPAWGGDAGDKRATRLLTAEQRRNRPGPTWRVEGLMPETGVGVLYGPTYVGKTFVALDLALSMCNAQPEWHGHRITQPGHVVYALMEGAFDFQWRVEAWVRAHPGRNDDGLFTLEEEELDLGSADSLQRLEQDIENAAAKPTMVVVDTQGLATPGRNEDKSTDMNLVYARCKRLAKRLGCFVLLVHHTGWNDGRVRGSSSQPQAADVMVRVTAGVITVEKVKAASSGRQAYFSLEPSGRSVWAQPAEGLTVAVRQRFADDTLRERAVEHVRRNPGTSKSQVVKALGGNKESTTAIVDGLVGERLEDRGNRRSKLFVTGGEEAK